MNQEYEAVLREIVGGLCGDWERDGRYLKEQMERYQDHRYGKEILRECGRLLYERIPKEQREELEKAMEKDERAFDTALEEIRVEISKGDYDGALKKLESMVQDYERMNLYANDAVSEYYCFHEPMEELLFRTYHAPEKELRRAQLYFDDLYFLYGGVLLELQQIEGAMEALEKAKEWNPANAKIAFEHAECFKMCGRVEDFGRLSREIFKYAFRPEDLARCYRNMAYYLVEIKAYSPAVCCLLYSQNFAHSEMVSSELSYIAQRTGKVYQPTVEELKDLFKQWDIPLGPEAEMLKLAYTYGHHFYEAGNLPSASYYLRIFASFIEEDEEVNQMLEVISKKG